MKVKTVLSPAEIALLPEHDLAQACCLVIDVLRATSSITTALAHRASAVLPVASIEKAEMQAQQADSNGGRILLGGERHGDRISGFDLGNSPEEYTECQGYRIVTTTTNGTVAFTACSHAKHVAAACLLNLQAVADFVTSLQPQQLYLICAGTFDRVALEDVYMTGALINLLELSNVGDDASLIAKSVFERWPNDPLSALQNSENGRALEAAGRANDVSFAAQISLYQVVPRRGADGWLRAG